MDAGDPQREFTFILNVNNEELYEVLDCPLLAESVVNELVDELNEKDDLSPFIRGMREY